MATMVLLLESSDGDFNLGDGAISELANLGVTNVSLLRDRTTVGIVLEGWLFDPAVSAEAAASAIGADSGVRSLQPVMHVALAREAGRLAPLPEKRGGGPVEESAATQQGGIT